MAKVVAYSGKPDQVMAIAAGRPTPPPTPEYNVVVMVLDDVATEWFEWMGVMEALSSDPMAYPTTPFLSSCADSGVWFDRASSESVCGPTRVTIQTGELANRTGFGQNVRDPQTAFGTIPQPIAGFKLPATITFLAEHLRAVRPEIATAAFGKWHQADCYTYLTSGAPNAGEPPDVNLDDPHNAGYQTYKGNVYNIGGNYTWWKVSNQTPTYIDGSVVKDETTYPSAHNAADFAAWVAGQTGPFFAYIAVGAPHAQYTVPPFTMVSAATQAKLTLAGLEGGDAFAVSATVQATAGFEAAWRAAIEATDTTFQRCYDAVPEEQRARTYFIITGDNGTVIAGLPPGFLHTKRELYWGGTRVPVVVIGPGVANPGRRAKQIIHTADIFRTTCDLMHVPVPTNVARDSVSFVSVLRDTVDREDRNAIREAVYIQQFQPNIDPGDTDWAPASRQRGVFDGEWRLVDLAGVEVLTEESKDPLEAQSNRLDDGLAVTEQNYQRLRALLDAQMPD